MHSSLHTLLKDIKDPLKEMHLIRNGLKIAVVEAFLMNEDLSIKDVLQRLHIPSSTYFSKKKNHKPLDSYTSEKFIRLMSVLLLATDILGKEEAKNWLYSTIPAVGNQGP